MRSRIICNYIIALILMGLIAGCGPSQKQKELENVAKDWCLTIRASQVIPVYPLTEDLEPGDIFLVQTPIAKQAEEYKKRGFLPLDQHMIRFSKLDYQSFYKKSFGIKASKDTPHHWQQVYLAGKSNPDANVYDPNRHILPTHWHEAPRAAFPSYSFTVDSSAGVQVALPIKGIPVGLSMMQAENATGTVTISDSYTYGVPFDELFEKVYAWGAENANRSILRSVRSGVVKGEPWLDKLGRNISELVSGKSEMTIYIRVVNRVYLAGSVDVSLHNTTAGNVWGKGGWFQESAEPNVAEPKDVDELVTSYNKVIKVNDPKTDIGGKFNVIWATNRSVSLSESFDRPLVIGYLGFDFPVMADGSLGAPICTRNQLLGTASTVAEPFESIPVVNIKVEEELSFLIDRFKLLDSDDQAVFDSEAAKFKDSRGRYFSNFDDFAGGSPSLRQVKTLQEKLEEKLEISF